MVQVVLTEIVDGGYDITRISPTATYPLPDPFGQSPTDQEVACQRKLDDKTHHLHLNTCRNWLHTSPVAQLILEAEKSARESPTRPPPALFRPLLLSGRLSLFCAILRIRPKSQGKCGKLVMNQLRDLQSLIDLSPVDPICNLGAISTKHAGSMGNLTRFSGAGNLRISVLGRKARLLFWPFYSVRVGSYSSASFFPASFAPSSCLFYLPHLCRADVIFLDLCLFSMAIVGLCVSVCGYRFTHLSRSSMVGLRPSAPDFPA